MTSKMTRRKKLAQRSEIQYTGIEWDLNRRRRDADLRSWCSFKKPQMETRNHSNSAWSLLRSPLLPLLYMTRRVSSSSTATVWEYHHFSWNHNRQSYPHRHNKPIERATDELTSEISSKRELHFDLMLKMFLLWERSCFSLSTQIVLECVSWRVYVDVYVLVITIYNWHIRTFTRKSPAWWPEVGRAS